MEHVEVAVVGAGLAGLATARQLARADRSVVVLEARDRVGGRTLNHHLRDGSTVEVGGQWVGPQQRTILRLIRELGLDTHPTRDVGTHLSALRPGEEATAYTGDTFGMPPHVLVDVGIAQKRLESMASKVPLDAPWRAPKASSWDGQTLESWLRRNVRTSMGRQFLRTATAAVFACEAGELSLLSFLFYIRSGGMLDQLLGTTGGAQQDRVIGGTQLISERMAADLDVRLSQSVRSIRHANGRAVLRTDDLEVSAERVVVAVPPALVPRISFDPPLSGQRMQLAQNMPMGSVIKTMTVYERPWWRDRGLSGQAIVIDGPISVVFDNSSHGSDLGVLLGFAEGRHAHELRALSLDARRRAVEDTLVRCFGGQARDSIDYVEKDWAAEEWSAGCYGGRLAVGAWCHYGDALRRPEGVVHWAGTETAEVHNGYMDGAVGSGHRAAAEVEAALVPRPSGSARV